MQSHADVIRTAIEPETEKSGPHALARLIHPHVGGDLQKLQGRVRAWQLTDSIPGEYWALLERLGVAPVGELAKYAEERRLKHKGVAAEVDHNGAAAQ